MLKKLMKRTKTVKSFLAVGAAVTMLLGTSLTALAYTSDNTTTPRVVTEADANVIATSDATQLYLTGSLTMVHDSLGSPDPVLVNNGDGSWVLIMYDGQTVALGVNNPYTAYTEYVPTITNTLPKDELKIVEDYGWTVKTTYLDVARSKNGGMYESIIAGYTPDYGYSDIYNNVIITGDRVGAYVYNLSVNHYYSDRDNYSVSEYGPATLSNTVTLAIYVLDAQAGAQTPTYTADEQYHQEHKTDAQVDWSKNTLIRVW